MSFVSILIIFNKSFRYQIAIEYIRKFILLPPPMLTKSEILMILYSKQKSLCQLANIELFPKRKWVGKHQENDKSAFTSDAFD